MNRAESPIRRLARRSVALTAVGVIAVAGAACGSSKSGGKGGDSAVKLSVTSPAPSGDIAKVSWALPTGEPTSIDPVKTGDYSPNTVVMNMCEPLMQIQPDFSVKPGLAESYSQPNPTTLVLKIRPGVKFWDGKPLTAADVAFSLNRNLNPKNQPVGAGLFRFVKSIAATGPLQVTVSFRAHDAEFLDTLADVGSAVSEQAFVDKAGANYGTPQGGVMCTGPFKFGKWVSGQRIVLDRNDDYWGSKAKAKEFDFVFFTDDSTLTSALAAGQVDGSYLVPLGSVGALAKSSSGKLYYGPSTESLSIGPVSPTGAMADPRIRQALDLAIDKPSLIANILHGAGAPQKTFTPPLVWAGDPAKSVYQAGYDALPDHSKADLSAAKKLVREAAPKSKTLTCVIPSGSQLLLQTATIVQADAKKIGLSVKLQQMQPTQYSSLFYDPSKRAGVDMLVTTGYIEVPGPYYYAPGFVLPQSQGGIFNWSNWHNPQAAQLITEGQQATDPQVAAKDFVAAQKLFGPADLQITLATTYNRLYMNKKITGAPASFAYISSPWAASVGKA